MWDGEEESIWGMMQVFEGRAQYASESGNNFLSLAAMMKAMGPRSA
jgi:hypothetical protein